MTAAHHPAQSPQPVPRWGLGDAAAAFLVAVAASIVAANVALAATGESDPEDLSLVELALLQVPQWTGTLGVTWWASHRKGRGLVRDFGLTARPADAPVGLAAGALTQLVLVPLVYLPILRLLDQTPDDVAEEARELTDKAEGAGVVLLVLVVVIVAPVVEEVFYRGLLLRSLERRAGPRWALATSSVAFGVAHFQLLQLPALVLFGLVAGALAQRTGRLGAPIAAHVAFNAVTVVALLA